MVVVGAGYIGYPMALLLASKGHRVLAVDTNVMVVDAIQSGRPLSEELEIHELAQTPEVNENLSARVSPVPSGVFVIAVPTPFDAESKQADLSAVEAAARSIVPHLAEGNLVVVESTVPPGTTSGLIRDILSESGLAIGKELLLAHCPERLHPGSTLRELVGNDRVIGGISEASAAAAASFYKSFVTGAVIETDSLTAELCKLAENTFRDVNLALANEVAGIAEKLGVDPDAVLEMASQHPRVNFLRPSIGVGGHCIPVDPWLLYQAAPESSLLIETARRVNRNREQVTTSRIMKEVESVPDAVVIIAGVAFKPDVPDIRESPAQRIAESLQTAGIEVRLYDPLALPDGDDLISLAKGAHLVSITVPHRKMMETIAGARTQIEEAMARPSILDFSTGLPRRLL